MARASVRVEGLGLRRDEGFELGPLDLIVEGGRITTVVGPNGAGKSTLLSLMTGVERPTSGRVRAVAADGRDPGIAAVFQSNSLFEDWTVAENLVVARLTARAAGGEREDAEGIVAGLGLDEKRSQPVGSLSGGWRRRLDIACGAVARAGAIVLDEPTVGLDAASRARVWAMLRRRAGAGDVVVVSTQDMEEVERHADAVVFLVGGRCEYSGRLDGFRRRLGAERRLVARTAGTERTALGRERARVLLGELAGSASAFGAVEGLDYGFPAIEELLAARDGG